MSSKVNDRQKKTDVQHVFLVGAKSLGAYGGYETFVDKLTEYHQNNKKIKYHVACKANGDGCMDETKVDGVKRISDMEQRQRLINLTKPIKGIEILYRTEAETATD